MIVGVLKEIKAEENRVCMTPAGVEVMRESGHAVLVEKNAGKGSGFNNRAGLITRLMRRRALKLLIPRKKYSSAPKW